jgi:hypothetical protein
MKANKTTSGQKVSNHRRKDKKLESSIDLVAHNQILKKQKQLNGRSHYIPMNINAECQWTQLSHQKTSFGKLDEKGISDNCCLKGTHFIDRNKHKLRVKCCKKIYHANGHRKQAGVAILISNKN